MREIDSEPKYDVRPLQEEVERDLHAAMERFHGVQIRFARATGDDPSTVSRKWSTTYPERSLTEMAIRDELHAAYKASPLFGERVRQVYNLWADRFRRDTETPRPVPDVECQAINLFEIIRAHAERLPMSQRVKFLELSILEIQKQINSERSHDCENSPDEIAH